jgi:molecular chaperone GrpE (heat shock protein)
MQNPDFSQQSSPGSDFSSEGVSSETTTSSAKSGSQEQGWPASSSTNTSSSNTKQDATAAVREEAEAAYRNVVQTGKRVGETIADEAKQMLGETVDEAKGQVKSTLSDQKGKAAENFNQVASVLRRTSQELSANENQTFAHYAEAAADQVERFSGYLKNHEVDELVNDLRDVARRQPEMFVAGALAAGFLIGRFLKSSGSQKVSGSYNQGAAYAQANPGQSNDGQRASYGSQYTSPLYGSTPYGSPRDGTTWEQNQPSTTQDIPIAAQEDRYGR